MKIMSKNTKMLSVTNRTKKLHCIICGKYKKFEKPKTSNIFEKTLAHSIICSNCKNEDEKIFEEEEESIEILKILGLIENI